MAKRRKLTAPSVEDLSKIEEEFRRETAPNPGMAPIAQVAAETAMNSNAMDPVTRTKLAELDRHRAVEAHGLVARLIPLDQIDDTAITRDRMTLETEEFAELKAAILANGLRMPVEVFELEGQGAGPRYGLISGYRRFHAVRALRGQPGQEVGVIEALVRPAASAAASMEAMVEENEIRADLSQYERGRIVTLAVQNGVYSDIAEATANLFAHASKAKRSKIRSFAQIFEQLGDVLTYPQSLTEKQGLSIAKVLRDGAGGVLRERLAQRAPTSATEEWADIQAIILTIDQPATEDIATRGGRPKARVQKITTEKGTRVDVTRKATGTALQIRSDLSEDALQKLLKYIETSL